jgi:hypothetical protein
MTPNRTRVVLSAAAAVCALAAGVGTASALPAFHTTPTSHTNPNLKGQPRIVDLRVGRHSTFDRVVIDVHGRRPSFSIRYTKKLVFDGSGNPVPLKGKRKMSLVIDPATAHNKNGSIYAGPKLKQLQLPTLRGVALTGDFEGVVSFGFTTDRKAPYRIFELIHPTRVVIDWKH